MTFLQFWELLSYVATALGVPLAIAAYLRAKSRERREREYAAYHAIDEKYLDYLRMCVEHPQLDLYYLPLEQGADLSAEEKIQQHAMCEILIALLERAFLMYRDQATEIKRAQWEGWNAYMHDWARRPNFRALWPELGEQFDEDFFRHMSSIIVEESRAGSQPRASSDTESQGGR